MFFVGGLVKASPTLPCSPPPPRPPRSVLRLIVQSAPSAAAPDQWAGRRWCHPSLPSDECTSDSRFESHPASAAAPAETLRRRRGCDHRKGDRDQGRTDGPENQRWI